MRLSALTLSILAAGSLAAQQPAATPWAAPANWTIKTDGNEPAAETKFQTMGPGFHVTSGPAAIYYRVSDQAKGAYTVKATFGQRVAPAMGHPEAMGVFIGGSSLDDASKQQYFYFEVRGDGKYYIAHRAGSDAGGKAVVHKIVDWAENTAAKKQDEKGAMSNELAMQVTADSVHMSINGQRVKSFGKGDLHGFNTDGQFGLRVNHMLNVHVANFGMSQ